MAKQRKNRVANKRQDVSTIDAPTYVVFDRGVPPEAAQAFIEAGGYKNTKIFNIKHLGLEDNAPDPQILKRVNYLVSKTIKGEAYFLTNDSNTGMRNAIEEVEINGTITTVMYSASSIKGKKDYIQATQALFKTNGYHDITKKSWIKIEKVQINMKISSKTYPNNYKEGKLSGNKTVPGVFE